jgi:hypothetical protein
MRRAQTPGYGAADALGARDGDVEAAADPEAAALPEALGPAEKLGSGLGVGDGKRVVGTIANERAKIRMTMTITIRTHGRASVSERGGSAPRYPAGGSWPRGGPPRR